MLSNCKNSYKNIIMKLTSKFIDFRIIGLLLMKNLIFQSAIQTVNVCIKRGIVLFGPSFEFVN